LPSPFFLFFFLKPWRSNCRIPWHLIFGSVRADKGEDKDE
jgi:hypothetical protein